MDKSKIMGWTDPMDLSNIEDGNFVPFVHNLFKIMPSIWNNDMKNKPIGQTLCKIQTYRMDPL